MTKEEIINAFNFRFACKEFDPERKIPKEDFDVLLEVARLSPSSFGLEPWNFIILQNRDLKEKIKPFSWGAGKQLDTASHFVIILARSGIDMKYDSEYIKKTMTEIQKSIPDILSFRLDKLKQFQEVGFKLTNERSLFDWASKQTYIALSNMMTTASLLGIDSCPIEGFDREGVENILLENKLLDKKHFGISCMAAFGYRIKQNQKLKTRRNMEDIVRWID